MGYTIPTLADFYVTDKESKRQDLRGSPLSIQQNCSNGRSKAKYHHIPGIYSSDVNLTVIDPTMAHVSRFFFVGRRNKSFVWLQDPITEPSTTKTQI